MKTEDQILAQLRSSQGLTPPQNIQFGSSEPSPLLNRVDTTLGNFILNNAPQFDDIIKRDTLSCNEGNADMKPETMMQQVNLYDRYICHIECIFFLQI